MGCGSSKPVADGPTKKSANFSGKGIDKFPDVPKDTEEIDLSENESLTDLAGVGALTALEKLDANACMLTKVPDEIESCASLEELLLYKNKIKECSAKIGALTNLTTLNLFNNQLKKLPPEVGELTKLEEVNVAANKMMMLTDAHFTSWASVKILSLYDNNLVRMGSLAPCTGLEELRISGNNLEEMPALSSHTALTTYEIHKNRIASVPDDYFTATPALQRLSIWGNQLTGALPASLMSCGQLVGVQAHENQLTSVPAGAWPSTLETLFLGPQSGGGAFTLAPELGALTKLKRVNLGKLALDDASMEIADQIKKTCLSKPDGIFWGTDGVKTP